ncbi:hypothetical protein FGX01_01025, partial [Xylella fastidiosa subsp. multiplex]|nr:hypothetical protein [Xylella fastidiosa subsp. multiplex]
MARALRAEPAAEPERPGESHPGHGADALGDRDTRLCRSRHAIAQDVLPVCAARRTYRAIPEVGTGLVQRR